MTSPSPGQAPSKPILVICSRLQKCDGDDSGPAPDVAHERLVLCPPHMLLLPASVAEVVEAGEVPGQEIRRGQGFEADLILSEAHPCLCLNKCNFVHQTSKSIESMIISDLQKYGPCFMLHNEHKVS